MPDKDKISQYLDYALDTISENTDTINEVLEGGNPIQTIPAFISTLIGKMEGITAEDAIVVAMYLAGSIDRMITKSGTQLTKEQKTVLLSKTVEKTLTANPDLAEELKSMDAGEITEDTQELQQEQPQEVPEENASIPMEEEGVF